MRWRGKKCTYEGRSYVVLRVLWVFGLTVTSHALTVHCARIPSGSTHVNLSERITMDPEICHGKPTIRGLRYTVESILELLSSGMSIEEVLADYEDLEREDILAALDFARQLSQIKRIESIVA